MTTWSGWVLTDRPALLAGLRAAGVALAHEVVVCDHITLSYPDAAMPAPVTAVVTGVAGDGDIQALVVEVDGTSIRPDTEIFHITLSRRPDVPDWASKEMLAQASDQGQIVPVGPWPVPTTPILRDEPDSPAEVFPQVAGLAEGQPHPLTPLSAP